METTKTLEVRYFAVFREQRGLACESVATRAATAGALYDELRGTHGFTLDRALVRVSINRAFRPMETAVQAGDEVVFIPPVAGG